MWNQKEIEELYKKYKSLIKRITGEIMNIPTLEIPTLESYGSIIGEAARSGDDSAQKIVRWYSSSHKINDMHGIFLAEQMAIDWCKRNVKGYVCNEEYRENLP